MKKIIQTFVLLLFIGPANASNWDNANPFVDMMRSMLDVFDKCVFGLVIDFGTSQSPKSTRPLTTYWCPSRPGHQALRNN
ncbi:hypothetical protein, partial [Thiolapillus sp.]|uniref:hypothetical protein n=1 Tax=Thiolapillus sp. TaxID=2017437 RepID=UPI003AF8BBF5